MSQRITKEDREIIAKVCPKFSRICQCYVNNPEYWVTLSPKAKRALNEAKKANKPASNKNVVSVRLSADDAEKLRAFQMQSDESLSALLRAAIRWGINGNT